MLSDLNLRVVAIRFQTRRGYNCVEDLDRRVTATKEAMKMAGDLGARVLVNQIGLIPESTEDASHELLRNVLSDLGRYSQHHGAFLACETGSEPLSHVLGLIEALPEGSLGVTLNPGNLIANGFDLSDLRLIARHILLVHAKDAVQDRARGRGMEVPLGRGLADFPMIVSLLAEQHYRGDFVIEREVARSNLSDLEIAVEFLRNI
jgi:sugar phosphate isomerase/epimerase